MSNIGVEFKSLIAYSIPGFVSLYAVSLYLPTVEKLISGSKGVPEATAIVPILFLSVGIGVVINAVTWALVRPLIELTGVPRPNLDYSELDETTKEAFKVIIDENYRYYQSYSNLLTSGGLLLIASLVEKGETPIRFSLVGGAVLIILFFASRDSLKRSYSNIEALLKKRRGKMTNGVPAPESKPVGKKEKSTIFEEQTRNKEQNKNSKFKKDKQRLTKQSR